MSGSIKAARAARAALERMNVKHTFTPNQIVEWKEGLKHIRAEGPFVVVEVLKEPVFFAEASAGTPYFREPLDVLLGTIDDDGEFIVLHLDSRRFQPIE